MRLLALLLLAGAAAAGDVAAEARELRREKGYAAAIDFLETRLDDPAALREYANCCLWGGQEERGLRGVRAAKVAPADRAWAEIRLLMYLYRMREAAEVARGQGWKEDEKWWADAAALRERLAARARRGGYLAALGAALLLGAWAVFMRSSSGPGRANA